MSRIDRTLKLVVTSLLALLAGFFVAAGTQLAGGMTGRPVNRNSENCFHLARSGYVGNGWNVLNV